MIFDNFILSDFLVGVVEGFHDGVIGGSFESGEDVHDLYCLFMVAVNNFT